MSFPGWMRCCGAGAASSSARPFMVFSSVPPLLCAFGSCTLNRTSWTTRDHLQETRQFVVGRPFSRITPCFGRFACDIEDGQTLSFTIILVTVVSLFGYSFLLASNSIALFKPLDVRLSISYEFSIL